MSRVGIVVVGRNEGERLHQCIHSLSNVTAPVLYVDSGSHDGSAAWARRSGVSVVELEPSRPMSAARARNAGFDRLVADHPDTEFVQFIDGDCALCGGWLQRGETVLSSQQEVGIVCGRVIERHPDASIYNYMCSLEWHTEPGEIKSCGGIFMIRVDAFRRLGGFRADVMAAEDDELCLRLRRLGFKIVATPDPMVLHDAAITRFGQWWTRARRTGMAYAQGAALQRNSPERHFQRQCRSVWAWGLGVPLTSLALAVPTQGLSLLGFLGYPALATRIYRRNRRGGRSRRDAGLVAAFNIMAKWPELQGLLHYHYRTRIQRRAVELIEYKGQLQP